MGERAARPPLTPPPPVPLEITRANQWDVKIRWSDGHEAVYPALYLRQACCCAVCLEQPAGQGPAVDPEVHPTAIQAAGTYAIEFAWSDGHATGIYPYKYLRALCPCPTCRSGRDAETTR